MLFAQISCIKYVLVVYSNANNLKFDVLIFFFLSNILLLFETQDICKIPVDLFIMLNHLIIVQGLLLDFQVF